MHIPATRIIWCIRSVLRGGGDDVDDSDAAVERRIRHRLAAAPEDPAALFRYAHYLTYHRLDYLRAEQLYQRALDVDEEHVEALVHYAYLKYLAFNDYRWDAAEEPRERMLQGTSPADAFSSDAACLLLLFGTNSSSFTHSMPATLCEW
jgi:tetratricopeptide (TPR) repeat protein